MTSEYVCLGIRRQKGWEVLLSTKKRISGPMMCVCAKLFPLICEGGIAIGRFHKKMASHLHLDHLVEITKTRMQRGSWSRWFLETKSLRNWQWWTTKSVWNPRYHWHSFTASIPNVELKRHCLQHVEPMLPKKLAAETKSHKDWTCGNKQTAYAFDTGKSANMFEKTDCLQQRTSKTQFFK